MAAAQSTENSSDKRKLDSVDQTNCYITEEGHKMGVPVPLNTSWTFWVDRADARGLSAQEFEQNLNKIYTVDTVQRFWQVFQNIPDVAELQLCHTYHVMRHEIPPIWEDEANKEGGSWRFKCCKADTPTIWKELLLAAIGEQFSDSVAEGDEILGVSACIREKDDVVQIWHEKNALAESARVVEKVHELLPDIRFIAEFYKSHSRHQYQPRKKSHTPL